MPELLVDLFSDTLTKPSPAMRQAMVEAEVGGGRLGQEPAVFLPSGTMCNEIPFAVHCVAGDEIILDQTAHPLTSEAGGPAVISRALLRPLAGERGIFSAEQVAVALRPAMRHTPVSRLVDRKSVV